METHFNGQPLGEVLRAAEADANRFHGARAPAPWRGRRELKGPMLAAGLMLLGVAGAMFVVWAPAERAAPAVTLAAARPAPSAWFTAPLPDAAVDEEPIAPASAPEPVRSPETVVAGKPPALADATTPMTLDGGDADLAASMPASVLTATDTNEAPRIAPMNVPTDPDPRDGAAGEPGPAD